MSAQKLSASACIYVRTATTKTKPQPLLWTPNRTIHQYSHSYFPSATPSKNKFTGFTFRKPSQKLGFLGRRAGLVTDLGSPVPPQPQPQSQPEPDEPEPSKLLTLPTILTLGRVAAVPLLVATFYMDGWRGTTATTSIFIAAAVTDWLDGYIARKMKLKSSFGAFLDPVADKLMVAATLVLLCTRPLDVAVFGQAPWLLTIPSIAIIGREITMSAVREWAASQDSKLLEAVAVNNLGKWKTATQMTALTILLATRDWRYYHSICSGVVLLYTSAGLAIWSLVVYMRKIWKVLLR
ncbi:CDP-diacylglycerol--glycerol-3-phosphate 3-phosphatidyltransferase 2-like isoform X2 [Gastrolobium bilobum]|uniref:CDP-diacylglycerol--glycerol-3-phosphate 3-phosphatidyltransferase 2-like isoform X2 n=1 Tax=Gastrolobium bilobum TaxID=150636 RepID=UPI002AB1D003|nr:CDP-diacylglycerol--glycerol-3-phosphate 3-phosphatidyltransferase 2-like isoform X2 [Gastrolobium bilobum]